MKIYYQLNKQFIQFLFLRGLSVIAGLFSVAYQYNFNGDVKLYFHYFPILLSLVYIIDFGYSEIVTKKLETIDFFFVKRVFGWFIVLLLLVLIILPFSENGLQTWMLISIIYLPFQAYCDAVYRLILKSNLSSWFLVYQFCYPVILAIVFFVMHQLHFKENVWLVFVGINIFTQLIFLAIVYLYKKNLFNLSYKKVENKQQFLMFKPFILKLMPLIIYQASTLVSVRFNFSSISLEIIRSSFFSVGFFLLLFYSKNSLLDKFGSKNLLIPFIAMSLLNLIVVFCILLLKYLVFKSAYEFLMNDIAVFLVLSLLYSVYLLFYNRWIVKI